MDTFIANRLHGMRKIRDLSRTVGNVTCGFLNVWYWKAEQIPCCSLTLVACQLKEWALRSAVSPPFLWSRLLTKVPPDKQGPRRL